MSCHLSFRRRPGGDSALMFLGKADEARKLFLSNRGRILTNKARWEAAILGDFKTFRKHGLSHPLMEVISAEFSGTQQPANGQPEKVLEAQCLVSILGLQWHGFSDC